MLNPIKNTVPLAAWRLLEIRKCDLIESYYHLRQDYEKFLYANYFIELITIAEIPPQDSLQFFNLLYNILEQCKETTNCAITKLEFEQHFLKLLGLFPNLDHCMQCEEPLWTRTSGGNLRIRFSTAHQLDSRQGGIRCPQCFIQNPDVTQLSSGTLAYWKNRFILSDKSTHSVKIKETLQNLVELDQAFFVYIRYYLGKSPKSHALLKMK